MEKFRVLTIPNDPLEAYDRKGYSNEERHNYFNPNHEFEVTLLGVEEPDKSEFEYAGFRVIPSDRNLSNIDSVIKKVRPHLVKGENGVWGADLSSRMGRIYGIPSLTTVHDRFPGEEVSYVDHVICVSEEVKGKCLERGLDFRKVSVIDNGTDLDMFDDYRGSEKVRELSSLYPGNPKIISVGRLTWEKNLERLFVASSQASEYFPDLAHIHIGRWGELRNELDELVKNLDMKNFYFLPNQRQEDLPFFYSWADAFTMSSLSEGFGIVYIEALACGTPVVTSNICPMNYIIQDGFNGVLVDPNSSSSIRDGIVKTFSQKKLHKKLRSNARKSSTKFDINVIKKKEAEVYKSLIESNGRK